MGVDYHAHAIIGVLLPEIPKAKRLIRKPAFDHGYEDDGKMEYDPKTGRKLWLEETTEAIAEYPGIVMIESYIDRNGIVCDNYYEPLREGQILLRIPVDLKVIWATYEDKRYIGFVVTTTTCDPTNTSHSCALPDINKLKEDLKSLLEPHDLWWGESFGLHSIIRCSF